MRTLPIVVMALATASLVACGGSGSVGGEASSSQSEEELGARAPIPFLLQYVGEYDGDGTGDIDWLKLRRNGTFVASVAGATERGRFEGPTGPVTPLKVRFIARGDAFTAIVADDYAQRPPRSTVTISRQGKTEKLTSTFSAGTEDMCDTTGGAWADDDADAKTGLYCGCPGRTVYIPSLGGCTR